MVIDEKTYYEMYIEGRTEKEIREEIDELKKEIIRMQCYMEQPYYGKLMRMHPSEDLQIFYHRKYLKAAILGLKEMGIPYILTAEEFKASEFQVNLENISSISLNIEFENEPNTVYEIKFDNDGYIATKNNIEEIEILNLYIRHANKRNEANKFEVIKALKELHMCEWRSEYKYNEYNKSEYLKEIEEMAVIEEIDVTGISLFGEFEKCNIKWKLMIEYNNQSEPSEFKGDRNYPYNFQLFLEMFDIELCDN